MNPYLCKFLECDRARDGNGFPRRWNQRDHMKRVHQYEEDNSPPSPPTTKVLKQPKSAQEEKGLERASICSSEEIRFLCSVKGSTIGQRFDPGYKLGPYQPGTVPPS